MKRFQILKLTVVVAIAAFMFQSCKKDKDPEIEPDKTTGSEVISTFFAKKAPKAIKVSMDATIGGIISGKTTKIIVQANSLVNKAGDTITGDVDFELTEYNTKGEMAMAGVTTVSGNEMLESAGMFNLVASQNGEEVFLAQGKSIIVTIDQAKFPDNNFQLFEGQKNEKKDENKVDWKQIDTVNLDPRKNNQGGVSFTFDYFKFGYCNIDRYFNDFKGNEVSTFEIKMPAGYNGENSWALLLFEDYRSCAWTYWSKDDNAFKTHYTLGKGMKCKVLAVSVIDAKTKEFEYELQNVTLTDNTVVDITTLQSITEAQIEAIVEAL